MLLWWWAVHSGHTKLSASQLFAFWPQLASFCFKLLPVCLFRRFKSSVPAVDACFPPLVLAIWVPNTAAVGRKDTIGNTFTNKPILLCETSCQHKEVFSDFQVSRIYFFVIILWNSGSSIGHYSLPQWAKGLCLDHRLKGSVINISLQPWLVALHSSYLNSDRLTSLFVSFDMTCQFSVRRCQKLFLNFHPGCLLCCSKWLLLIIPTSHLGSQSAMLH